jgi:hypothetical protein
MPFDQAPPIQTTRAPDWGLPEITDVKIRAASYQPRPTRNFTNPVPAVENAIEIVVTLKAPIPARALAPVLYVGSTRLTESEPADKEGKLVRFWALDPSKLQAGAPIVLMWTGEAPPRQSKKPAKFTYKPPK